MEEKTKDNMEKSQINEEKKETLNENKEVKQNKEDKENKSESKEEKKAPAKIAKKEEAVAKGTNFHASKKHCMYISSFIKNKSIDQAIKELEEVIKFKRVIPFKGEIPHRSQPNIMSGRYPISASKEFINLLKALKGNVIVNGLDLDKTRIYFASATWASRPAKRGGMRFKRSYVVLKAKEFITKGAKK